MANYRQVHVSLWKDEWFLDLEPEEKLLFIYLFSNESTSLAGIYKIAFKVICFETGLDPAFVKKTLKKLSDTGKVYYEDGVVWVVNMRRYHETSSTKVQTRIRNDIDEIPDCPLKIAYLENVNTLSIPYPYQNAQEEDKEEDKDIDKRIDGDVEEEPNPDGIYTELSVAFCNKTKIPELTGGPEAWFKSLEKMGKAGVTVQDIEKAIDILREKDYSIVRLSSIENTAISEMSKRVGKKDKVLTQEEVREKYTGGEYADYIEH